MSATEMFEIFISVSCYMELPREKTGEFCSTVLPALSAYRRLKTCCAGWYNKNRDIFD